MHPEWETTNHHCPAPGARHDAYAFRTHRLDEFLDSLTLGDKGYVGLGLATPIKRKPGQYLSAEVKRHNWLIIRLRLVAERVIVQFKTWWALHTGFRRPLGLHSRVFLVVRGGGVLYGR